MTLIRLYQLCLTGLLLSLLLSCAQRVTPSAQNHPSLPPQPGETYVLIGIDSSRDLKSITMAGSAHYKFDREQVLTSEHFLLLTVQSGQYVIQSIEFDHYYTYRVEAADWTILLDPGTINYAGHIEVGQNDSLFFSPDIELINRSSEALKYLEQHYAELLKNIGASYAGPGHDEFIAIATQTLN